METIVLIVIGIIVFLAIIFLLIKIFMSPMVVIKPTVTGSLKKYLKAKPHDINKIYEQDNRYDKSNVILPFSDVIADNLEAMSVIHFKDAEGLKYIGLEPQVFKLQDNTTLVRMLATTEKRDEGDIYLKQGELQRDKLLYRVTKQLGKVRDILEADFSKFELSVKDTGLYMDIAFKDRYDRNISLKIDQQKLGKKANFKSMIAPASLATHHQYFPLIFLGNMSIADKKTEVNVSIDGEKKELLKIPVLGADMIIYDSDTVGFYLFLETAKRQVKVFELPENKTTITTEQPNYEKENAEKFDASDKIIATHSLKKNGNYSEISESKYSWKGHSMQLHFAPALPNMLHLKNGAEVSGKFAISVDKTPGIIAGTYKVNRNDFDVKLFMQLNDAYQPVGGDKWVSAYSWEAVINLKDENPQLNTKWHKKEIVNYGLKKIKVI
jgi:hypothetical protein